MEELWKDIKDYEGVYQVSNLGRVRSLKFGKERILRTFKDGCGYLMVHLCKDGKPKMFLVHRLVASSFLENPENLPCVNHKDEDKTNNFIGTPENNFRDGNLEWCTNEYNTNYGTRNERAAKTQSKPVLQFSKTGSFIREWSSTQECERNGFNHGHIVSCCIGERKTHKGFHFRKVV